MTTTLAIGSFKSRAIRKKATGNKIRKFLPGAGAIQKKESGGLFSTLINGFAKFSVSLLSETWKLLSNTFTWSATAIWSIIVRAKEFLFNFNWNPSDAELDKKIASSFNALPTAVGTTLGKTSGYLLCGALPGAILLAVNEPLGQYVFVELGEEALDEFAGELANLIRLTFTGIATAAFNFSHKQLRTLWRESDDKFKKRLESNGIKKKDVEAALAERNKPFIIREKLDKKVESIKSKPLKDFVENFLEEFDSSCVEAGYVIAGGIDAYAAQQAATKDILKGKQHNVEVTIDEQGQVKLKEFG